MPIYRTEVRLFIDLTLSYIAQQALRGNYDYTPHEPFADNSEAEYNLVVWNDPDPQPTWQDILDIYEEAFIAIYFPQDHEWIAYINSVLKPIYETELPMAWDAIAAGLNRANHIGIQSADTIVDGTTNKVFTNTLKTKLAGISAGASSNDTDVNLKDRANHTGTQAASTISDFASVTDSRIDTKIAALVNSAPGALDTLGEIATALAADESAAAALATTVGNKVDKVSGKGLSTNDFTGTLKTKLDGIEDGAQKRKAVAGITLTNGVFPVFKNVSVSSAGSAVFHLTDDGLSTGSPLFAVGGPLLDSLNVWVNDATAAFQWSAVFSNSNKTLTVTINKLTTANILSGILGQTGAPVSTVVRMSIWGS